jgi:hypothetical protein
MIREKLRKGLERHVLSLERRVRTLRQESAAVARELIAGAGVERRSARRDDIEREFRRLQGEVDRLERERLFMGELAPREDVDEHLHSIERQLHDVLAEREEWQRASMLGRRRRVEDLRFLEGLREEQERLTAELIRCAQLLRRHDVSDEEPRMRRVWKMLRLSGA